MKTLSLLIILHCVIISLDAQKFTLSGFVEDAETGEKLIGANVFDQHTQQGTITNNFGFFSLTLVASDSLNLVASYIGYSTHFFTINELRDTQLNIVLKPSVTLDEVEIVADEIKRIERETQMSVVEVPIAQIKKIPALLGEVDVLKALQLLPGVQSGGEGQNGLYIRGGSPDQNLILLDGVPVYNASHLFGFFSVFNADAIKDVKLIKGGFPARYGGRLSSVVEINMKEGNRKEFHGAGSIGLIASKLTLEGPIGDGKTSYLVSGRRTYIDVLAQPLIRYGLSNDEQKGSLGYYFYDLNAKLNHTFSDKDRLYFSAYTGKDKFYANTTERSPGTSYNSNKLGWGNLTNALRWNHIFTPRLFANTMLTYSRYRLNTDIVYGSNVPNSEDFEETGLNYGSGIDDFAARLDFDFVPSPTHFIRFGTNVIHHTFSPGKFLLKTINTVEDLHDEETIGQPNLRAWEFGNYIEDDWSISDKFKVNAGAHFSAFHVNSKNYFSLQPRLSSRYLLTQDVALKASFATMRQYLNLLSFDGIGLPTDLWLPTTARVKPQDSWQAAVGAAKTVRNEYEVSIELFYKKMENLLSYKDGAGIFQTDDWQNRVTQGDGEAYGAEFFVQKKRGKFSGWVGYTLSWNYRTFEELNEGRRFPFRFDRRHDISVVGSYKLSEKVNFGMTWVYGTGNAVTLTNASYSIPEKFSGFNGDHHYLVSVESYENRNNFRMRSYHRMDVGANFVKKKKRFTRTWSVGAYNAYSNNNPFYILTTNVHTQYPDGTVVNNRVLKQTTLFPIIPYVNYSFEF